MLQFQYSQSTILAQLWAGLSHQKMNITFSQHILQPSFKYLVEFLFFWLLIMEKFVINGTTPSLSGGMPAGSQ